MIGTTLLLAFAPAAQAESLIDFARLPVARTGVVRFHSSDRLAASPVRRTEAGTIELAATKGDRGRVARIWLDGGHPRAKLRAYFDGAVVPAMAERIGIGFDDGRPPLGAFWSFDPLRAAGARVTYPPLLYRRSARVTISSALRGFEIEFVENEGSELVTLPILDASVTNDLPSIEIGPGESKDLGAAGGKGTVREFAIVPETFVEEDLDALRLRIFVDGETMPSIEGSLAQLYARPVGAGTVDAVGVVVSEREVRWRLPMPFHAGIRAEIRNDGPRTVRLRGSAVLDPASPLPGSRRLRVRSFSGTASAGSPCAVEQRSGKGHWIGLTTRIEAKGPDVAAGRLVVVADGEEVYRSVSLASAFDAGDRFGTEIHTSLGSGVSWIGEAAFVAYSFRLTRPIPFRESLSVHLELPGAEPVALSGASFLYADSTDTASSGAERTVPPAPVEAGSSKEG